MINLNPIITIDEQNADGSFVYERDLIAGQFSNKTVEAKVLRRYRYFDQPRVLLLHQGFPSLNLSEQDREVRVKTQISAFAGKSIVIIPIKAHSFPNLNLAAFMEHIVILENGWSITPGMRMEYIRTEAQGFTQILFLITLEM